MGSASMTFQTSSTQTLRTSPQITSLALPTRTTSSNSRPRSSRSLTPTLSASTHTAATKPQSLSPSKTQATTGTLSSHPPPHPPHPLPPLSSPSFYWLLPCCALLESWGETPRSAQVNVSA